MNYESQYGTKKRVEQIKEKAIQFVKRLPGEEEDESEGSEDIERSEEEEGSEEEERSEEESSESEIK